MAPLTKTASGLLDLAGLDSGTPSGDAFMKAVIQDGAALAFMYRRIESVPRAANRRAAARRLQPSLDELCRQIISLDDMTAGELLTEAGLDGRSLLAQLRQLQDACMRVIERLSQKESRGAPLEDARQHALCFLARGFKAHAQTKPLDYRPNLLDFLRQALGALGFDLPAEDKKLWQLVPLDARTQVTPDR